MFFACCFCFLHLGFDSGGDCNVLTYMQSAQKTVLDPIAICWGGGGGHVIAIADCEIWKPTKICQMNMHEMFNVIGILLTHIGVPFINNSIPIFENLFTIFTILLPKKCS